MGVLGKHDVIHTFTPSSAAAIFPVGPVDFPGVQPSLPQRQREGGREGDGWEGRRALSAPPSRAPDGRVLEKSGLAELFKPAAAWQPGGDNERPGGGMFPHA